MMRLVMAAIAVAMAVPVAAQDVSSDYGAAYARIYSDQPPTGMAAAQNGLRVLPGIQGDWMLAAILMNSPDYDSSLAEIGCSRNTMRIERLGEFGFSMETMRGGEPEGDVRTFMFSNGNYFSFVTDLNGLASRLYGTDDVASLSTESLSGFVFSPQNSGVMRVERIGDHALVMDSPTAVPMVLVRCP